jgi:hypothetical protein
VIVVAALSFVALTPELAQASPRLVYVDIHVNATWPVGRAVNYIDQYTGSDMRFGKCRANYKCIVVREKYVKSSWVSVTYLRNGNAYIYLNPYRRNYSWQTKYATVAHEIAHANGILQHNSNCRYLMYAYTYCPDGSVSNYMRLSAYEKQILQRH